MPRTSVELRVVAQGPSPQPTDSAMRVAHRPRPVGGRSDLFSNIVEVVLCMCWEAGWEYLCVPLAFEVCLGSALSVYAEVVAMTYIM